MLRTPWPILLLVAVAAVAVFVAARSYTRPRGRADRTDRMVMGFLRGGALLVLLIALLQAPRDQAAKDADAVLDVDDEIARRQIGKVGFGRRLATMGRTPKNPPRRADFTNSMNPFMNASFLLG